MIKLFEQFNNEQEIIDICTKYNIENYTINPDGSIDVNGDVDLDSRRLTELPLSFNRVSGSFWCSSNQLTTLKGSPSYVGNKFSCSNNQLTSLKGSPIVIESDLYCSYNPICVVDTSVEVKGMIIIDDTKFYYKIKLLNQDKLRILFEHGVDYMIFKPDGTINDFRLQSLFNDFNI